jgi:hypothetical protein
MTKAANDKLALNSNKLENLNLKYPFAQKKSNST